MTPPARSISGSISGAVWFLAACSAGLSWLTTLRGPGLENDSIQYLSTAVSLGRGDGLVNLSGTPLTVFPPLYPLLLALGDTLGLGVQTTARLIAAASAALLVLLAHVLITRLRLPQRIAGGALVLVGLGPIVLNLTKLALTEAPFAVVTLALLVLLGGVCSRGSASPGQVAAMVALTWAAFFLRYAGVANIAATALVLLIALRASLRRAVATTTAFGLAAVAAPVAWMLRNHAVDGTYLGPRVPSPDSPTDVAVRVASVIGGWIAPVGDHAPTAVLATIGVVGTVAVAVTVVRAARTATPDDAVVRTFDGLGPALVYTAVYLAYLSLSQLATGIDPINARLMSPVFVPAVMVGAVAVAEVAALLHRRGGRWLGVAAASAVGFVVLQVGVSLWIAADGARNGVKYNALVHTRSPLAAATLRQHEREPGPVFANAMSPFWAATGLQPAYPTPRFEGVRGAPVTGQLEAFAQRLACDGGSGLVAAYHDGDADAYAMDDLRRVAVLTPLVTTDDGVLYRATPLEGAELDTTRC